MDNTKHRKKQYIEDESILTWESAMSDTNTEKLLPFWVHLTEEEKNEVKSWWSVQSFKKEQLIISSDAACMGVVVVLKGGVRVCLISDEGREITLYRLKKGGCCVTTASCVISQITFETVVSATEDTELLVIPAPLCARLAESNIYFRCFMFETETQRFSQAIWAIQQILFKRFDQRLAQYLITHCEATGGFDLRMTQEEVARDVNSAREVVARMLRCFTEEGYVEVKRGHIIIKNIDGLRDLL